MFLRNFFAVGWTVEELLQIKYFQYGCRQPSWIRCTHARDHPRCRIDGPKKLWKFCPNRLSSFWDIAIFPFQSIGWGFPIHAQILFFVRGYDPLKVVSYHRYPKRHQLVHRHVVWAIASQNRLSGVCCRLTGVKKVTSKKDKS